LGPNIATWVFPFGGKKKNFPKGPLIPFYPNFDQKFRKAHTKTNSE